LQACSAYQRLYNAQSSSRGGDSLPEFQLPTVKHDSIDPTGSHSEEPQLIKFAKANETADDNTVAKSSRRKSS